MILGIGCDIVRIERIAQSLEKFGDRFVRRIFTDSERHFCEQRGEIRKASCFAKRFAAKEALVKALGTGIRKGIFFSDIEVVTSPSGQPVIHLSETADDHIKSMGLQWTSIYCSLSDEADVAMAVVVIEQILNKP